MSLSIDTPLADTRAPRARGTFERFWFWPIVGVLALVLVELGARALRSLRHQPYVDSDVRAEIDRIQRENRTFGAKHGTSEARPKDLKAERLLHPFIGFATRDELARLDQELTTLCEPDDPQVIDVLVLGGAAARQVCELHGERLAAKLAANERFAGKRVRLHDFGRDAFKQPQQLELALYLLALGARPEIVVEIDGRNELLFGLSNAGSGTHPSYPSLRHWAPLTFSGATDRASMDLLIASFDARRDIDARTRFLLAGGSLSSLITGHELGAISQSIAKRNELFERYRAHSTAAEQVSVVAGPPFDHDPDVAIAACVNVWRESSRTLADLCRGRGLRYLQVIEPFGLKPSGDDASDRQLAKTIEGRAALVKVSSRLSDLGVEVVDVTGGPSKEASAKELAAKIADAIADRLVVDPPKH